MVRNKQHIGGLDLIRFFAAALVLFFHLAVVSWASSIGYNFDLVGAPKYPALQFLDIGWVGVEIFFVLSGLVIAQSAEGNSAYRFFRGRIGRLMPAILITAPLTTIIVLLFKIRGPDAAIADLARTLVFEPRGPWVSGVYWTLQVEVTFYAAVWLILLVGQLKRIELFASVLGIASSGYIIGRSFYNFPELSTHLLLQHGCFFSLGIFVWLIFAKRGTAYRYAMTFMLLLVGPIEIDYLAHGVLSGFGSIAAPVVWLSMVIGIWVSMWRRWAGGIVVRTLGLMTYPLYLFHYVPGAMLLRVNPFTGKYLALAIATSAVVFISWIVTRIERPLRKGLEAGLDALVRWRMSLRSEDNKDPFLEPQKNVSGD